MDFLRGILNVIPGAGLTIKAVRQMREERNNYPSRNYSCRFDLSEILTIKDRNYTSCDVELKEGSIELSYANHNFTQSICIFGTYKSPTNQYPHGQISRRSRRIHEWRQSVSRLSEKLWNQEVTSFRRAFINGDSAVHDQIRVAILYAMGKQVCEGCLDERTKDHNCGYN